MDLHWRMRARGCCGSSVFPFSVVYLLKTVLAELICVAKSVASAVWLTHNFSVKYCTSERSFYYNSLTNGFSVGIVCCIFNPRMAHPQPTPPNVDVAALWRARVEKAK